MPGREGCATKGPGVHIVSVIGSKGGNGKSSTTLGLAVAGSSKGHDVCIIDLDPQGTAAKWSERRGNDHPAVTSCPVPALSAVLKEAEKQGARLCILDSPGKSNDVSVAAAKVADLVLLPIAPTLLDIEQLAQAQEILTLAGGPAAIVVLNRAPVQGRRHVEARAAVIDLGFTVCPHVVFARAAHSDALNLGQTATEFSPDSKAAEEMMKLYAYVTNALSKDKQNAEKQRPRRRN
jgi:chromosome partitioning protein